MLSDCFKDDWAANYKSNSKKLFNSLFSSFLSGPLSFDSALWMGVGEGRRRGRRGAEVGGLGWEVGDGEEVPHLNCSHQIMAAPTQHPKPLFPSTPNYNPTFIYFFPLFDP